MTFVHGLHLLNLSKHHFDLKRLIDNLMCLSEPITIVLRHIIQYNKADLKNKPWCPRSKTLPECLIDVMDNQAN